MSHQAFISLAARRAARLLTGTSLALAVALALRLPYLTTRSLWFDEAASWQQAKFPISELPARLRFDTILPPFFVMLKVWMAAFGESAASVRGFAVTFGSLTALGMYLFALELYRLSRASTDDRAAHGGTRTRRNERIFALVVALLVAASPFQVNGAIEVRMYAPGGACAAFSGWLLLRALRLGLWRAWALYAVLATLTLFLHPYLLFSVAAQFAVLPLVIVGCARRGQFARARDLTKKTIVAGITMGILFLPALPTLIAQHRVVHASFWIKPLDARTLAGTLVDFAQPVAHARGRWFYAEAILLAAALFASAVIVLRRARLADWVLLASACFPFAAAAVASFKTPIWAPRYFRFAHLYLLALLVLAVWRLLHRWPALRAVTLLSLLAGMLVTTVAFWERRQIDTRPGMRGAIQDILASRAPGEALVATSNLHFLPAKFYTPPGVPIKLLETSARRAWPYHFVPREDLISNAELETALEKGVWLIGHGPLNRFRSSFELTSLHRPVILGSFVEHYDHGVPDWPIWVIHCASERQVPRPTR